ncbi:Retrovirus-related Pol polyprotein from transposon [Ceratobasidium sp. AG-Ba]|nr:Retrovirus-related Pol polyprotein from transposon [Ceratobasidium sp. AG-Ba]
MVNLSGPDTNTDLRAARRVLENIGKFDNKGKPCSEEEWRHKFLKATHDVTSEQRAALWADSLAFKGEAYKWLEALKKDPDQAIAKEAEDWSKLVLRIESRWPTPIPDLDAHEEAQRTRFITSYMEIQDWADILCNPTNATRPQQAWAMLHRTLGHACDSTDRDHMLQMLNSALPPFVVSLLPNRSNYGKDFNKLCKDISELSNCNLYNAWRDRSLLEAMSAFSLSPLPTPPPIPATRSPSAVTPASVQTALARLTPAVIPATPSRSTLASL